MRFPGLDFHDYSRIWFLTWTTYGTWLPGDERGFVSPKFDGPVPERRNNRIGIPYDRGGAELHRLAEEKLIGDPVYLSLPQAELVHVQVEETATHRDWRILAGAIMTWHVHLVVGVPGDPEPSDLMRDFKSHASRKLNRAGHRPAGAKWWTENGSKRKVRNQRHLENVVAYVLTQDAPLVVWSPFLTASAPEPASGER